MNTMNTMKTGQGVMTRASERLVRFATVLFCLWVAVLPGLLWASGQQSKDGTADEIRLITLDPGHFHAALLQKEMLPGVSKHVAVYAPLGPDLIAHLSRIGQFNARQENPTDWDLEIYAGTDYFEKMLEQRRGNVVVLSGRNHGKIARIRSCIDAGFHVLADKPWILESADLPKLEATLNTAEGRGTIAFDIMTERFEITYILQRELVNDAGVFGAILPGNEQDPCVLMESVHHLMKNVAGVPLIRPAWFFDIRQQGEGLADIGTHLADLVQWSLFPGHPAHRRQALANSHNQSRIPKGLRRRGFPREPDSGCQKRPPGVLLQQPLVLQPAWRSCQIEYPVELRSSAGRRGLLSVALPRIPIAH